MSPIELFKSLADHTRLRSLLLIHSQGELCVCELMVALGESQPKISRHLAQLRANKILLDRRQGQWVFYRINPELPGWVPDILDTTLSSNRPMIATELQQLRAAGDLRADIKETQQ
ncbi:metalloregulator ArsR/SmtB family transcription factor [Porticoccus sp. W117]|uniref:metalloregulator ArsR/SmtB family transcription factor n=1 Tax=Porticoccus sp. W117 TaxID=3054777 RepID=UPI002596BA89|nr:metalloregulator ArsR/SmtB family transcription factor [Porticoccus sp. W117]MDM3870188.1 metalloregulator ArsR/SmtB family transcription factor [Porticoccus sp. W117]